MFQYMKRHLLLVSVFTVASIGLTSSAQADAQSIFGGLRGGSLECICVEELGGAVQCAWDLGPCASFASTCTASGDADCPDGLCLGAAYTGCPTNACVSQTAGCNKNCPVPTTMGNIVYCDVQIPTLPEWGLAGLMLLVLTAGTVVFGRRRRAAA